MAACLGSSDLSVLHIMKLALTLCYVALSAAVDVKLHIDVTSETTDIFILEENTGCRFQRNFQDITCKAQGSDVSQVPANYFSAIIDCTKMNTSSFDSLTTEPWDSWDFCSKITVSHNMETSDDSKILEIKPGSITNFTCVFFPEAIRFRRGAWEKNAVLPLHGMKKGEEKGSTFYFIFMVRYNMELAKVHRDTCLKTVEESFQWGLSLVKSSQNVHEVLWTSQAKQPEYDLIEDNFQKLNIAPLSSEFTVTKTVKDEAFKDLHPRITQAACSSGNFANLVTLTFADQQNLNPKKHEEKLQLSVDATQLPKGTKELEVTVQYTSRELLTLSSKLKLPVHNPEIDEPTTKPTTSQSGGSGVMICLILVPVCLIVAAFFCRRHQRIQASREVYP